MVNTFKIEPKFKTAHKAVRNLEANLSTASLTASLTVVHGMLLDKTNKMFDKEQDAYGRRWAELSPATKDIRRSLGFGEGPINTRTGKLRSHMTQAKPSITGHSDAIVSLVYPGRQIPNQEIARRLNQSEGIKAGSTARSVFPMVETDIAKILTFMNNSLFRGLMR